MAWKNRIANHILTATANLLYGARLTDEATAYKAFRATVFHEMHLECRRFEFCPEVTAEARAFEFASTKCPSATTHAVSPKARDSRARWMGSAIDATSTASSGAGPWPAAASKAASGAP